MATFCDHLQLPIWWLCKNTLIIHLFFDASDSEGLAVRGSVLMSEFSSCQHVHVCLSVC